MSKLMIVARVLNWLLLLVFFVAIAGFISFANVYGFFLATVTAVIAWFCYKHNRWGYFAAGAWALACFQLAKQGYEFQSVKRHVMIVGFILIPIAVFLHETLAKVATKSAQNNGNDDNHDSKMPD
jgi:hypothetical protein